MGPIDTHTHVQFEQFDADRDQVLAGCWRAGLEALVVVGTDLESSRRAIRLSATDNRLHPTAGIHPHDASTYDEAAAAELRTLAASGEIVAIGEIGLDFYRNLSPRGAQVETFLRQLDLAAEFELPVVVHTRNSIDEVYSILTDWALTLRVSNLLGVMHCFSGTPGHAREFANLGFMISIPATITYPQNEDLRRVARELPLDSLVVETDSPYLPPQRLRGRRNDPANVLDAIGAVAEVRGQPQDEIVKATSANARRLFRL
jgi:TatD DNase family protein